MGPTIYLDTARLGRMSPTAQQAQRTFAEIAGEEGTSPYFEHFLLGCCDAPPFQRFSELTGWRGVGALKRSLRRLAGGREEQPVLIASRSAQLMKLAARLLFHVCENVLVTDLGWPGYHEILEGECRRASRRITTAEVRDAILSRKAGEDEVVSAICAEFARRGCDGLFLTAVSSQGVRLPVERIVRALEARHEVWFVAIDGAQDFCHAASELGGACSDFYLTGAHKWLGAHCPMGLGFYGQRRSRDFVGTVLAQMLASGDLDDPLLRFSMCLEDGVLAPMGETVNLLPLFACQGAVSDTHRIDPGGRAANAEVVVELAEGSGWLPLRPVPPLRSGILLLQAERPATRLALPDATRAAFRDRGVALSCYEDGLIRLSMPDRPLQQAEQETLREVFRLLA